MGYRSSADYGRGEVSLGENAAGALAATTRLDEWIRQRFQAPDYRPPVPPTVAIELQKLAQDADVDIKRIVKLLETDAMLTAQVLRLAASPLYTRGAPVRSLHDAITRLGLRTLTDLVWEAGLKMRIFRVQKYAPHMETIRKHSVVTAVMSRVVAGFTPIPSEYAFLAGLVHDIGLAATLIVLCEEKPNLDIEPDLLVSALSSTHEALSGLVAQLWKLPDELQMVLGHHHVLSIGGYIHPLAAVVCLGESLASELKAGVVMAGREFDTPDVQLQLRARAALRIEAPQWELIAKEAKRVGQLMR